MNPDSLQFSSEDILRLLDLVASLGRERKLSSAAVIDSLEALARPAPSIGQRVEDSTVEFVERMRQIRLNRNTRAGANLFRDAAWDMLLELFAAHHHGRVLTVSSLCYASGVPISTALRQLQRLIDNKLVERIVDRSDFRRSLVRPTSKGFDLVMITVNDLIDHFCAIQNELRAQRY